MRIVCVGDCGVDLYLPGEQRVFGGITANFARHARREFRAEDSVAIVSAVGDDEGGKLVLSSLRDAGIDCHIQRLPGTTPVQSIEVQADGERKFTAYDAGVLNDMSFGTAEQSLIASSDLLVAPVYLQIVGLFEELMSIPSEGLVSIDFADFLQHPDFALLENHLDRIDIAFFGLASGDHETIAAIRSLAIRFNKLFVVTLGAAGSIAFHGGTVAECPAAAVDKVVDTTGAGDAFAAGFLAAWCEHEDVAAALRRGARLAAGVIQHQGACQD